MADDHRQTGGKNNKKGNRYEDSFAVCRCLELAPSALQGVAVSLTEQAGCPVDDLLIREGDRRHYHQLKNHQTITWGAVGGKLGREFAEQRRLCLDSGEDHTLNVVVAHRERKDSLDANVPAELTGAVTVRHFPETWPPSQLALLPELQVALGELSASRHHSQELANGLASGFHQAWVETIPGGDGASLLGDIVHYVRERPAFRLRRPVPAVIHAEWLRVEEALSRVPGLEWHTDRGYFEWDCGNDRGLVPLDSAEFARLTARLLESLPETFDDFEAHL